MFIDRKQAYSVILNGRIFEVQAVACLDGRASWEYTNVDPDSETKNIVLTTLQVLKAVRSALGRDLVSHSDD